MVGLEKSASTVEAKLEAVVENMAEGVVIADANGQVLHWNRAALKMHGFHSSEEWCLHLAEFTRIFELSTLNGQVLKVEDWPLPRLIRGERFNDYELRVRRLDIDWEGVFSYGGGLVADADAMPLVFLTIIDIAERTRTQHQLREEKAFSDTLLESLPGLVFLLDSEWRLVRWNRAAEEITGYSAAELASMCLLDLAPPEDRRGFEDCLHGILNKRVATAQLLMQSKACKRTAFVFSGVRLASVGQALSIAIGLDITERNRLEQQLQQAQKMEAIGQLAGGVAHDFNNLLTVISGYSDLVLSELPSDSPFHGLIQEIQKAGDRAASLTKQLLAFSRKQVLELKVLDLNAVVTDTEKMLRRLIGEDVSLTTVLSLSVLRVKADLGQVQQVIMNLAVNSRDAMPLGGKLTIETAVVELDQSYTQERPDVKPGRYAMLAVTDTGCGMDNETKARLFEPFFTTKGPGAGTGLGLATVYGIIKQCGGSIYVYSELGQGATFKIYLPLVADSATAAPPQDATIGSLRGNETILLVEDESAVRALSRYALASLGYTVLEASNGYQATRVCEAHGEEIDLVVSDVVMPEMGGRQVVEQLAAMRPELRVLYLSGYTDDAVVRHGVLEAETAFLQKPFTLAALATKVREVLEKRT